ncbi:MAG: DUF115 domain-containing protein [bacterium]|nr:DUF115 domain-containing protein [bacterium]
MNESIESLLLKSKPYLAVYLSAAGGAIEPEQDGHEFHLEAAKNGQPVVTATPGAAANTADAQADSPAAGARPTALASRYDPGKDAARLLADVAIKPTDIVLVLGLGNPVVLEQITARLGEKQICLAVDAHLNLGRKLCAEVPDLLRYLARPGCHLFAGEALLPSLRSYIEGLPAERLSGLRVLRHPASLRLAPDFYDAVEGEIRDIIKSKMSDLLTRFEFEQLWLKNILINSRYLPPAGQSPAKAQYDPIRAANSTNEPGHKAMNDAAIETNSATDAKSAGETATVAAFADALRGSAGLLVSAGPSLRESLELIAAARSKCFILACDTALKPLLKAGIVPHAVITLDAQRHTLFAFQGVSPGETVLFADLVSNPAVLRSIAARTRGLVFSTTAQVSHGADGTLHREVTPGTEHAELIHGPVGAVQSGGSVATSGFDLLRTLGCDPICIVGQDLAYTGRRIHTVGTHHQERWLPLMSRTRSLEHIVESVVRKRKTHPVPAIQRGEKAADDAGGDVQPGENAAEQAGESQERVETVLGDYVLNLYRMWFDQSIPAIENRVVNLSAAGAHLSGAEHPVDPAAFVRALPDIPDPGAIFQDVRPPRVYNHERNSKLQAALAELLGNLESRARRADSFAATDDAAPASSEAAGAYSEKSPETLIEDFFAMYPYLRPLIRRSEVYLKRNREKLGEERARKLARRNTVDAFRNLWRGLRPYF